MGVIFHSIFLGFSIRVALFWLNCVFLRGLTLLHKWTSKKHGERRADGASQLFSLSDKRRVFGEIRLTAENPAGTAHGWKPSGVEVGGAEPRSRPARRGRGPHLHGKRTEHAWSTRCRCDHKIISYVEILDHVELSKYFPHFSMMNFEKVKPRSPRVFGTRELHGFTFLKFIEKWRI